MFLVEFKYIKIVIVWWFWDFPTITHIKWLHKNVILEEIIGEHLAVCFYTLQSKGTSDNIQIFLKHAGAKIENDSEWYLQKFQKFKLPQNTLNQYLKNIIYGGLKIWKQTGGKIENN